MKKKVILLVAMIMILSLFIVDHATPENAVRGYLFFSGHSVNAMKTDIYWVRNDEIYGNTYSTRNPGMSPDFIAVYRFMGLWFVNRAGCGGG